MNVLVLWAEAALDRAVELQHAGSIIDITCEGWELSDGLLTRHDALDLIPSVYA